MRLSRHRKKLMMTVTTTTSTEVTGDAPRDCALCPRLRGYIEHWRQEQPDWHNAPVPTWVPPRGDNAVKILIVGLAPGLRGANRTGVPFTGDSAGDVMFATLKKFGFAAGEYTNPPTNQMKLKGVAIANTVACVPPDNKPVAAEINMCASTYLAPTIARFTRLRTIVTLGKIAHDATVRTLGGSVSAHRFGHNQRSTIGKLTIVSSYHCSRYNMNTGRLTQPMFDAVFEGLIG